MKELKFYKRKVPGSKEAYIFQGYLSDCGQMVVEADFWGTRGHHPAECVQQLLTYKEWHDQVVQAFHDDLDHGVRALSERAFADFQSGCPRLWAAIQQDVEDDEE